MPQTGAADTSLLDPTLYDKTSSLQANFQNSQFGLLDEQPAAQGENFSKNLHKTLKSILPNANISFGAVNGNANANANANFHMGNPNRNSLNFNNMNGNNFWPDDPAIVSLTDRSHLMQNGAQSQFQSLNDFQMANNANNGGNRAISPLSNNKNTINNMKMGQRVNNLINQNQKLNENSTADQMLNSHQYLLQNFSNGNSSANGKSGADENLNVNLAQHAPFLYRFNSSFNNDAHNNNNNNSLLSNGLNDQFSLLNQENSIANLNLASLTLQQQFFMQQLSTNYSSKKLPSE
jgi:hypothetical protein